MTIDQFEVLEAILRMGSFRAAAQELNRAQSAVSYAIRNLETDVGFPIFDRSGYRPRLTEAGEAIARRGRDLLAAAREINQTAALIQGGQEPQVRVDIAQTAPLSCVIPVLKRINQRFPTTQIIVCMEIFGGEQHVLEDRVDLSLTPVLTPRSELEVRPWRSVRLVPVASASHPLAQRNTSLADRDLAPHVQIVITASTASLREHSFGIAGGQSTWSVGDFATKKALILEGLGWGNLPEHLITEELGECALIRLDWKNHPHQDVKLSLTRLGRRSHGPVARALWELFLEHQAK